jgi:hypothetical protein
MANAQNSPIGKQIEHGRIRNAASPVEEHARSTKLALRQPAIGFRLKRRG